jgi:hypothetical protein
MELTLTLSLDQLDSGDTIAYYIIIIIIIRQQVYLPKDICQ